MTCSFSSFYSILQINLSVQITMFVLQSNELLRSIVFWFYPTFDHMKTTRWIDLLKYISNLLSAITYFTLISNTYARQLTFSNIRKKNLIIFQWIRQLFYIIDHCWGYSKTYVVSLSACYYCKYTCTNKESKTIWKFTAAEKTRLGENERKRQEKKKRKKRDSKIYKILWEIIKKKDQNYTGVSRIHRVNVCLIFAWNIWWASTVRWWSSFVSKIIFFWFTSSCSNFDWISSDFSFDLNVKCFNRQTSCFVPLTKKTE